jgi:hypothetical protein
MTRNMTITALLMLASVAAAVASPELPSDFASCDSATLAVQAPQQPATIMAHARMEDASVKVVPTKAMEVHAPLAACDMTEPYRMLHHGSLKLAPGCSGGAAI